MTKSEKNKEEKIPQENENKESTKELKETPEEQLKTTQEKLLRAMAEIENQRRRFDKEKQLCFKILQIQLQKIILKQK